MYIHTIYEIGLSLCIRCGEILAKCISVTVLNAICQSLVFHIKVNKHCLATVLMSFICHGTTITYMELTTINDFN